MGQEVDRTTFSRHDRQRYRANVHRCLDALTVMLRDHPFARDEPITRLTAREREVLELMAEGRSNSAIAQRLFITEKAVGKHSTSIFAKLGIPQATEDHRRVLAVLTFLRR